MKSYVRTYPTRDQRIALVNNKVRLLLYYALTLLICNILNISPK